MGYKKSQRQTQHKPNKNPKPTLPPPKSSQSVQISYKHKLCFLPHNEQGQHKIVRVKSVFNRFPNFFLPKKGE